MSGPLSFTPAGRQLPAGDGPPVRRRHVLFVPGYDPEAETRYRRLFVRELIRYAKRAALGRREVSAVEPLPGVPGQAWRVRIEGRGWTTETRFEVLLWDDIVRRDFDRPLPLVILLLVCGLVSAAVTGTLFRFFRVHWKFGGVILYPAALVALFMVGAFAIGWVVDALLAPLVAASNLARWALTLGVAGLVFSLAYPLGERWFVWHLMHDWVFNFQHGMGWRRDYERRVELFATHLASVLRDREADEILVVGHSSGSSMAVEIVAAAVGRMEAEMPGRRLVLLTIGSCVPLIAFNPVATAFRASIRSLMTQRSLLWVEYQAPQDWINFASFNPQRHRALRVPPDAQCNPVIRSARFREIVADATYRDIAFRPFRMHFQFLNANDNPGEYDYLAMVTGPLAMEDRLALGDAAPGRFQPAASPSVQPSTD